MASTSRPAGSSSGTGGGPPGLVASFVQSPKLVIATVAVTSSLATAGVLLATQRLSRKARRTDLEDSARRATAARLRGAEKLGAGRSTDVGAAAEEASTDGGTPRYLTNLAGSHHDFAPHLRPSPLRRSQSNQPYDESLVREQLARHYSFLGDEGMAALRGAFVVVVGAGGVGSACALSLLRAGVGAIRLIDFDQVSLSSLNRHAVATLADVGRPKVVVCSEHFARIAPWAHVEAWVELFKGDEAPRLLGASRPVGRAADAKTRQPTYVIDAIDNLDTKVELLAYCYRQGIKCFSSMGAGAKCDPSRIQIADLSDTSEDPLSRHVRRKLRMMGIPSLGPAKEERKKKRDSSAAEPTQAAVRKSILQGKDDAKPFEIPSRITLPKNELKGRAPLVASPLPGGAAANSPRPPPSAWASASSTGNRHMRRASSASSMGSAAYHTPLGTPMLEGEGSGDEKDADDTVRLPEAALADEEEEGAQSPMPSLVLPHAEHRDSLVEMSASPLPSPSPQISSLGAPKERNPLSRAASTAGFTPGQDSSDSEARPVRSKSESKSSENVESERLGIPVVFSTETKSDVRLLPLPEEEYQRGNVEELAVLNDFRVRVLPVLGPIPAMFGLAAATYVICDIAGRPQEPIPVKPARRFYEKIWQDLEATERRFPAPGSGRMARDPVGPKLNTLSTNDCAYVYDEVFHQRSIVPPFDTPTRPALLRWDSTMPLALSNVAVFSKAQAKRHEDEVLARGRSPFEVWGNEAGAMFKRRMAEERRMSLLR